MKNLSSNNLFGIFGKVQNQRYYGYGDPSFEKLIVIAVIGVVAIFGLFFGVIMPPGQLVKNINHTPALVAINNKQSPISAQNVLFEYSVNSTVANREYTGNLVYLNGIVANVEGSPGNLESCVDSTSIGQYLVYGCSQASSRGGWIIWHWSNATATANVPLFNTFIVECVIGGVSSANLFLESCTIAH